MSTPPAEDEDIDRFASVLGDTLAHAADEAMVLAKLEEFFHPKPARLGASSEAIVELNENIRLTISAYGGPPQLIIQAHGEPKPRYDTYLSAAIGETIRMFDRCRSTICRAQASMIGAHLLSSKTDFLKPPYDPTIQNYILEHTSSMFWEHAETGFIRLAGFWDRVGQVLDFVFFSIRQYERDGFSAVLDRIRSNTLRMHPVLESTEAWQALWAYKKSERSDGLQWLLSRRNLLVHSLHLRAAPTAEDEEIYESAFNHLDARLRGSLAIGTPEEEIQKLHTHLSAAAALFPHMLLLCRLYAPLSHARSET
jgi:hypothetical protein